eukprot:2093332-Rhodomonas_salina.1
MPGCIDRYHFCTRHYKIKTVQESMTVTWRAPSHWQGPAGGETRAVGKLGTGTHEQGAPMVAAGARRAHQGLFEKD